MITLVLWLSSSVLWPLPPVFTDLAIGFAVVTLITFVLLAVVGGLGALYLLFPHVRTAIENRLPADTGRVVEETLAAVDRVRVQKAKMAPAPDPGLQPTLFPVPVTGEEVAHA